MRRIRLNTFGARRVHAARQHVSVSDGRLLPRNECQVATFRKLLQPGIELSDLRSDRLRGLINVVEVEIAYRMQLVCIPLVKRFGRDLGYVILKRKPPHFVAGKRAIIKPNVLVARFAKRIRIRRAPAKLHGGSGANRSIVRVCRRPF